jgi:RecA/RadA recombinase
MSITKKSVKDKLKSYSIFDSMERLSETTIYDREYARTQIPAINIALGASLGGGVSHGVYMFAGPSKHFKSLFGLVLAKAYMDKYEDAEMVFFDCEYGISKNYFKSVGIDAGRVGVTPFTNLEELKFELVKLLDNIPKDKRLVILLDSLGNTASKKELDDALEGKSTQDMTRAKVIKSIFRSVTPMINAKKIPFIVVNHTYNSMDMYPQIVIGGGTGSVYASETIFTIGKNQEKDSSGDIEGYNFVLSVNKGRSVREKSKIPITVRFDGGIDIFSGLLDMGVDAGLIYKHNGGWYSRLQDDGVFEDTKYREKDTNTREFWQPILTNSRFKQYLKDTYAIAEKNLLPQEDLLGDLLC